MVLVNHVVAVEVICCYRTCVETDEVVFAVTIAVEGDFHPNRAICHHRDSLSMDSTHHRLNPSQPCLEGWRQIKNVENVALRSTLMSSTVPRQTRSVCAVAR